jgi:integrase
VRPIGLPVLEYLEGRYDEEQTAEDYVFPGWEDGTPFGSFPRQWTKLFKNTDLAGITPHILRHSSPASATIWGSPRRRLRRWSVIHEER